MKRARGQECPRARKRYFLHNHDIFCFELVFERFGERFVGNEYVDILRYGKGVGLNFTDFRAIEHHIRKRSLSAHSAEQIRLVLRSAREPVFGRVRGRGHDSDFDIRRVVVLIKYRVCGRYGAL